MSAPAATISAPALLERVPAWSAPAALVVAAGAGAELLDRPAGLGLTVTAWAVFAIVAGAVAPRDRWAAACWLLAGALAALVTLRAAGWLQVLSLLFALPVAAVAAFGARRWKDVGAAFAWSALALVPGPLMVAAPLFRRRWNGAAPAVRGALLAVPLLLVFGALFAAADAGFAALVSDFTGVFDAVSVPRVLVALLVAAIAGALLWTAVAPRPGEPTTAPRRPIGRTEWTIALVALDTLFALFVALQAPALFGGHERVVSTSGLTYAENAHQGFGQLLAAAALTLLVVAAAVRWCARSDADDRLLRLLLGALCVLCLVVLASAWQRLGIYVEAFGASRLRALAQFGVALVGGVLALVLVAGTLRTAAWLPRAVLSACAVCWLGFALANPEARIAATNLARAGNVDEAYLHSLSEDAAGVLPARLVSCSEQGGGVAGFNLSRARC